MMMVRQWPTMTAPRSSRSKMMLLYCILSTVLLLLPVDCAASSPLQVESLVKSEPTAPKAPLLQGKPHLKGNRDRLTQTLIVDDGSDNASAAYLKCYRTLDEVSNTGTLNQEQYVEFLKVMTDGRLSINNFQDLAPTYVMVFYTAACTEEDDCVGDNVPEIDIGTTEDPVEDLQLFCKHVLKNTESVAPAAFEYSIRYDPSTLQEDALANCLAEATVNILLERLTTCLSEDGGRRLVESNFVAAVVQHTLANYKREQHARSLQALGSASSGDIDCDYSIDVTVDRITDSACEGEAAGENERCALVRSTATVAAPQILEPFESLLRIQVVTILRDAIDTGEVTELLNSGECAETA